VHLALEISSEEELLRLGTLVPMNVELPTKYPLSQDRIVVFEIRLHSKSPMLYRPSLHGNWNALSLIRRTFKDKFPTPTVPLTTVLQNRQVFLLDPVEENLLLESYRFPVMVDNWYCWRWLWTKAFRFGHLRIQLDRKVLNTYPEVRVFLTQAVDRRTEHSMTYTARFVYDGLTSLMFTKQKRAIKPEFRRFAYVS
jgi:hypothetical protein